MADVFLTRGTDLGRMVWVVATVWEEVLGRYVAESLRVQEALQRILFQSRGRRWRWPMFEATAW